MSKKQLVVLLLATWVAAAIGATGLWRQVESAKSAMVANREAIEAARQEYLEVLNDIRGELRLIRADIASGERREKEERK